MAASIVAFPQRSALRVRLDVGTKTFEVTQAEPLAYSIDELAQAFRVSRATLYNLWKDGAGPVRMRVRGRVVISRAAAEAWRADVEAEVR